VFTRPFRYERAGSLVGASEALRASEGTARILAGGQSLLPMINLGLLEVGALVDVSRLTEHRDVGEDDGFLEIGALIRHRDVVAHPLLLRHQPLLPEAARHVGSARIRNRGTLGGSLTHCDPAAELPLAMVALGAEYKLVDAGGTRSVRADEFHVSYFTSALEPAEVLASVRVPKLGPGWGWGFAEVSRRPGDFALVAAAALVRTAGGEVVESRVALGGVSERPLRLGAVEASLGGGRPDELEARVGAIQGLDPVTDTSASADHRRHLARVLTLRAVADACRRAEDAA